jgi:hypothetical protein
MNQIPPHNLPKLTQLPSSLPSDGAISIVLEKGIPSFRASSAVVKRIDDLLQKEESSGLTADEAKELAQYEEIDDYLSHLNRVVRNLQSA